MVLLELEPVVEPVPLVPEVPSWPVGPVAPAAPVADPLVDPVAERVVAVDPLVVLSREVAELLEVSSLLRNMFWHAPRAITSAIAAESFSAFMAFLLRKLTP